jgi:putative endonuclease
MAWVYILECNDGSFYVGSTLNLENRVVQHNNGQGARYTARRRPVTLVWAADYYNVADAFTVEKQIQNWSRAKRIALIEGRFADLPLLAKKHGVTWQMRRRAQGAEPAAPADGLDAS